MRSRRAAVCLGMVVLPVLAFSGCGPQEKPAPTPPPTTLATKAPPPKIERIEATAEAVKKAQEDLRKAADRDRRSRACLTFEDFKATVYKEPFEGGKYIVNGDTTILNEKQLREFFEKSVKTPPPPPPPPGALIIMKNVDGTDASWNEQEKRNLTYCVSREFGTRYDQVVQQMASATSEWEKSAAVHFIHEAAQDASCGPSNAAVVFDVRPVNVNEEYLARAFFPNEPRAARNVLIDESSFNLPAGDKLQLGGVLRHELGHTIGFRHEHTRPESGACFEDRDWRPLTSYDAFSVMHYPQCHGEGDWSLTLTDKDRSGAACVYGAAPGFTIDGTLVNVATTCTVSQPVPSGQPQTQSFNAQSVALGQQKAYGPFPVAAGSPLQVTMGGAGATGDPDLYVRFGSKPTLALRDCRPFLLGPTEACNLTVPAHATQAFVMVHGYAPGTYDLQVTRVP